MLNNESQVRLTINLEGRLAAKAANSNSKKEKKLATILEKKGKKFFNSYSEPSYHECTQSTTLSSECVKFFTSEEGRIGSIPPSTWKKMSKIQRLEANLQINADMLSGKEKTEFSYSIIS